MKPTWLWRRTLTGGSARPEVSTSLASLDMTTGARLSSNRYYTLFLILRVGSFVFTSSL
jgi:hypothetical protein